MTDKQDTQQLRLIVLAVLAVASIVSIIAYRSWPAGNRAVAEKEEEERDSKKKRKKVPLPEFQTRIPVLLPGVMQKQVDREKLDPTGLNQDIVDRKLAESVDSAVRNNRVKPGHWYTAHFPVIANYTNVDGELESKAVLPTTGPIPVPGTEYEITATRPVALAKREWKNLETSLYVPTRSDLENGRTRSVNVQLHLKRPGSSVPQTATVQPIQAMRPFQYHFVVLSNRPDNWNFLKVTDSFQMPGQLGNGELMPPMYTLVPSRPGDPIPLARSALEWTTVAYVLWDNLSPSELDIDQQGAMLDWLHHGGQLIVSGPDCLDQLQSSFLADHLPAKFDCSIPLAADDVATLNENWAVESPVEDRKLELTIPATAPIQGVRFQPHPDAQFVEGCGEVAIERQIGRGRIVITAFSLSSRRIRKWRSLQSFLNGALLRKPARKFVKNRSLEETFRFVDDQTKIHDPLIGSTLRFLSRDLGVAGTTDTATTLDLDLNNWAIPPANGMGMGMNMGGGMVDPIAVEETDFRSNRNRTDHWHYGGYQEQQRAGIAGWNDRSAIADAARRSLKMSAGIDPPSADFVMKMLGTYLIVLVPLNWLVFRLLGKVEYAWAMAPVIAICGAISVVRMASLDIGFVRSNSELGLLEVFADHPRAHYTQYSALYTSLSTHYTAELDNEFAQALPFAYNSSGWRPKSTPLSSVTLRRSARNRLENFQVQSNSTGMLHTESMLELGGVFSLNGDLLTNASLVGLQATGVIRRTADGDYQVAWVGELAAGQSVELTFETVRGSNQFQDWQRDANLSSLGRQARTIWTANVPEKKAFATLKEILSFPELADRLADFQPLMSRMDARMNVSEWAYEDFYRAFESVQQSTIAAAATMTAGDMFDAVARHLELAAGEVRLLGVTDQTLGTGTLEPAATQTRRQTLVVAHLTHPKLPPARRDANVRRDLSGQSNLDAQQEAEDLDATVDERMNDIESESDD